MKQSIPTITLIGLIIGLLSISVGFTANTVAVGSGAGTNVAPGGLHQSPSSGLLQPTIVPRGPSPGIVAPVPTPGGRNPSPIVTHPSPVLPRPYPGWRHPYPGWRYPRPGWRPGPGWRYPGPGWYWGHHFFWEFRFWPRPPLPWHWAPPPPVVHSWWYWVWWQPLPISVQYYYPPTVAYPYDYTQPAPKDTPEYYPESQPVYPNPGTETPSNVPQIKSQQDYENWLSQTLNLTDAQQKTFITKFRELAELRENFIENSTTLGNEIQNLQKTDPTSTKLTAKQEKLQNAELDFRKKEQKLMNELMAILTLQQREAFMNQMKQYTPEPTTSEETPTE